jgi:hypothetical protein
MQREPQGAWVHGFRFKAKNEIRQAHGNSERRMGRIFNQLGHALLLKGKRKVRARVRQHGIAGVLRSFFFKFVQDLLDTCAGAVYHHK